MKNKDEYSVFSQRLKQRREELGYTQEALASKTGEKDNGREKEMKLNKSQIGKYETIKDGVKGFPILPTAIFLAKELKCSLDWLCGISDIDTLNPEHSDSESVEVILLKIITAILEEEITDWSIEDLVEDKTVILLKNDVFEEFVTEYREAIDLEYTIIEKFGKDSPHVDMATEHKEKIFTKYVQKYAEQKKC